jgi:gliding motility-associated-like protein
VTWNGVIIPPDSSVTFALQTVHGCDSTVQIQVIGTTIGTYNHVVDTAVCLGQTLSYLGFELNWGEEKVFNLNAITGCDSTVLVKVAPLDTFYLVEDRLICYGDSSEIFGVQQTMSGVYPGLFKSQYGCDSTHLITLWVLPQIQLDVAVGTACFGESDGTIAVSSPNGVQPLSWAWDFGNNTSPNLNNLAAGNYQLTVTDGNDCTETEQIVVDSYSSFSFSTASDSVSCFGLSDGGILLSGSDPTLTYSLDGGPFQQVLGFDRLLAGTYEIQAQDVFGCTDTLSAVIFEPPLLTLKLPSDTIIQIGQSLPLPVQLSGLPPVQWIWQDTSYLSCFTCIDPVSEVPLQSIRYHLTILDENGCTASDEMLLTVDPIIRVYFPNAIGGEGENSRFDINFGPAVRKVNMLRIFDRWGNLLHEVRQALPGDSSVAWDGRYNGSLVNPGVYVWLIEMELYDGSVLQKKGDLTVVR